MARLGTRHRGSFTVYPVVYSVRMDKLREYLNSLSVEAQGDFARRCGTTIGYLRKAIYAGQRFDVGLLVAIERESNGSVRCEDLRPEINWSVLRGTSQKTDAA